MLAADRLVGHHPPDDIGIVAIVAAAHLLEHRFLPIGVAGRAIGLGGIEADRTVAQSLEDTGCEPGKADATFNEARGDAEPLGDVFGTGAVDVNEVAEGRAFVGRVHGLALIVFGEAGFAGVAAVVQHQHRDRIVLGQRAVADQLMDAGEAAAAGGDFELAGLFGDAKADQVLQDAARGDIGLQLRQQRRICRGATNVGLAEHAVARRDHLDGHGVFSD